MKEKNNFNPKGDKSKEKPASLTKLEQVVKHKNSKESRGNNGADGKNINFLLLFFPFAMLYFELVLHLLIYKSIDLNSIFVLLFPIPTGLILAFISSLFSKKVNKVLTWLITIVLSIIFIGQYIYYNIFTVFLALYTVGAVGTDALEFTDTISNAIRVSAPGIMILLLPIIILSFCSRHYSFERKDKYYQLITLLVGILFNIILVLFLPALGRGNYTPYDLYHNTWEQAMSIEALGLLPTTANEIIRLAGFKKGDSLDNIDHIPVSDGEKPSETNEPSTGDNQDIEEESQGENETDLPVTPTPVPIDTSPNVLDINFADLIANESNKNVISLHEYFVNEKPTLKNEYTGMFEGYNLIFITAEGFSPYAVDKEVTPTLYKLTNSGFVFNNFYTSLWWSSTIDGEYVAQTGLVPKPGVISFHKSADNYMPFALGNQFTRLGYNVKAYHNHTYSYYKRDILYPNMGYVDYKGLGNGLDVKETWPESDLEMMEKTIPEYIDDNPFHVYYMTVSGHMNYTFVGNSMSAKNKDLVEHLPYSDEAKAYIACNIELDRALEKLISELEEKNIADKTVIALSADHYPYGLEKQHIDQIAGYEVEENFELYKNHFILWSASIEEPIIVDKPGSSIDIIPTLSNLFGLEYDSRLFAGRDLLSNSEPLVIFSNRSFITDKVMYNSKTKEVINLTDEPVTQEYIDNMIAIVKLRFLISENILDLDYYNHIGLDR